MTLDEALRDLIRAEVKRAVGNVVEALGAELGKSARDAQTELRGTILKRLDRAAEEVELRAEKAVQKALEKAIPGVGEEGAGAWPN